MPFTLTLFGQALAPLELAAVASGLASVWLAVRVHPATWPAGIVSVACYAVVFLDARLYANALLQLCFVVLGIVGWRAWSGPRNPRAVGHAGMRERIGAGAAGLVAGV